MVVFRPWIRHQRDCASNWTFERNPAKDFLRTIVGRCTGVLISNRVRHLLFDFRGPASKKRHFFRKDLGRPGEFRFESETVAVRWGG